MSGLAVRASVPPSSPDSRESVDSVSPDFMEPHTVYLDADERTNRILMVGYAEQLAVVEEVIGALDVVQQDQRTFTIYEIRHVDAEEVRKTSRGVRPDRRARRHGGDSEAPPSTPSISVPVPPCGEPGAPPRKAGSGPPPGKSPRSPC